MVNTKHICFFLIFLLPLLGYAQNAKTERMEISDELTNFYECIPFAEHGFLLKTYNAESQTNRKTRTYTYVKYDTSFSVVSSTDISLFAKKAAYLGYTSKEKQYCCAYQNSGLYTISIIDIRNMNTQTIQGKLPKHVILNNMRAIGDYVYLQGYVKDLPILYAQNIKTQETTFCKIIPLNKRHFSIMSFEVNETNNEVYLFTKDVFKNDQIVKFYSYKDGVKTLETQLRPKEQDKFIVSAFASRISDGSLIVSGTYGNSSKSIRTSVGIYISKLSQNGDMEYTKYVNYLDITNFTSYLSERKQGKIEKKQDRLNNRSKELEINYFMVPHKIIESNNEYTLIGEAYYPTYRQECHYITTAQGQTQYCYPVFDGYQYTHFFILNFNGQGELLWSNSSPMDIDDKPYSPIRFLSVNKQNHNLQLVYSSWNKLHSFSYENGDLVNTNEFSYIKDEEKLLYSTTKNKSWYDNTFISYGTQRIKNKDDHTKRDIYFIEKIKIPTNNGTH